MNSGGNITEPINSIDPYQATGTPAWSDGSYPIAINAFQALAVRTRMWARYKPVPGGDADENIKNSEWWKGLFGRCGLDPLSITNTSDIVNYCNGTANGWTYTLAALTWARLLDWSGYKHTPRAYEGIGWVTLQGSSMTVGDTGVALIFSATTCETYDLGYADFAFLQACRFGAYLKRDGANGGMRVIAQGTVLGGADFVTLSGQSQVRVPEDTVTGDEQTGTSQPLTAGTWRIYPFLFVEGTHYSIPYANVLTLTVNAKSANVTIKVTVTFSALKATYTLQVTNNTSGTITLNNNSIYFRKPSATGTTGMEMGEDQQILTIGAVSAAATKTITGDSYDAAALLRDYGEVYVHVILGTNAYSLSGKVNSQNNTLTK